MNNDIEAATGSAHHTAPDGAGEKKDVIDEGFKQTAVHLEYGQHDADHQIEFTGRQFGTMQGYDETGRVILNPQPSDSPDDPLNYSYRMKQYLAAISCAAVLVCNLIGAGPSIAIIEQTIEFVGAPSDATISKTAYLLTTTALCQGVGLFIWVPAVSKFGRRPMYILSFSIYFVCIMWCAFAKTYEVELAGRILIGLSTGAGECLGALTVNDVFFAHERGLYMAYYNVFLACGAAVGLIMDGAITQNLGFRYFYYIDAAIVGVLLLLVVFTFPETHFDRNTLILNGHGGPVYADERPGFSLVGTRKTFQQRLKLYNGVCTRESYFRMAARPFGIVFLPAVMFSVLTFSATIGFLVAVTSNVAPAYEQILGGFDTQKTGFLFFGALIGSLIGIPAGGWLGDKCADYFAKKNNGVREPEHRLPAMIVPIITGPLSLVLYGLCIGLKLHWFVGCLGLSLVNFNVCAATNITMVYTIDCYKPIADEVVNTTLAFKAIVGFVLGFYTNTWVGNQGYIAAYGEMAAIEAGLLLLAVPMWMYGKRLRNWSATWSWLQWAVKWDDDRDDLKVD